MVHLRLLRVFRAVAEAGGLTAAEARLGNAAENRCFRRFGAIGFAFKDILQNWLSGLLILYRQPFRRGDQIRSGTFEGSVEAIEARATILRTYDGHRLVIPNTDIYTQAVTVHTAFPSVRAQYDVGICYGDDIEKVCGALQAAL